MLALFPLELCVLENQNVTTEIRVLKPSNEQKNVPEDSYFGNPFCGLRAAISSMKSLNRT